MSYDFWSKIKPNVEFYRLLRGETQTIIRPHVLLIEGRISINGKESGPGYYRIHSSQVVNVLGSAKFYLNEEGFVYSE